MKSIAMGICLLLLAGCSGFAPVATNAVSQIAKKTTTTYDAKGIPVQTVEEDEPVLGTQLAYQRTLQTISNDHRDTMKSVATGLQKSMTSVSKDNSLAPGTKAIMLYRGFESFERLGEVANVDAQSLAAVQRSLSGFEVLGNAFGQAITGAKWYGIARIGGKTFRHMVDGFGDHTNVSGNENALKIDKRRVSNNIHANTTGANSPSNPVTTTSTGCESGNCNKDSEESPEGKPPINGPNEDNTVCIKGDTSLPIHHVNDHGDAFIDDTCSCLSWTMDHCGPGTGR